MPKINVDFTGVDDVIKPLPAGVYTMKVTETELTETANGKGEKVVVTLEVSDPDSPQNGRKVFDHISTKMLTNLKRLALSCGLTPGADGLDVSDLVGCTARVQVKTRTYQDKETNETKETSSVAKYLIPGDER